MPSPVFARKRIFAVCAIGKKRPADDALAEELRKVHIAKVRFLAEHFKS